MGRAMNSKGRVWMYFILVLGFLNAIVILYSWNTMECRSQTVHVNDYVSPVYYWDSGGSFDAEIDSLLKKRARSGGDG